MLITSIENDKIRRIMKYKEKKYRDIDKMFLVEGEHLVIEAYKAGLLEEILMEQIGEKEGILELKLAQIFAVLRRIFTISI